MQTHETHAPWWLATWTQRCAIWLVAGLFLMLLIQSLRMAIRPGGNDFTIYLKASRALASGQNPYLIEMRFPYLYPLFLATVLLPFTWLPFWLANAIWLILGVGCLVGSCVVLLQAASSECGAGIDRRLAFPALVILLVLFPPVLCNAIHGQVNSIVLFCCTMFYGDYVKKRAVRSAVWLAIAAAIKLTPLVLLAFLIVRREFRALIWTIVFTVLFILLPAVVVGTDLLSFYRTYFDRFLFPLTANVAQTTQTHFSLQGYLNGVLPTAAVAWSKTICCAIFAAALFAVEFAAFRSSSPRRDVWPFSAYLVGALLISPVVELHHFLLVVPAVFLIGVKTFYDRSWTKGIILWSELAFVGCFVIATRFDPTMLSYFISLGILLFLLFEANRRGGANERD